MSKINSVSANQIQVNSDISKDAYKANTTTITNTENNVTKNGVEEFSLEAFTNEVGAKIDEKIQITKDGLDSVYKKIMKKIYLPSEEELIGFNYDNDAVKVDDVSIYNQENKSNDQFGGNQMLFSDDAILLLLFNEAVQNQILEKFPNATLSECIKYIEDLGHTGCGYIAAANSVFQQYEGREEEFYEKFGYNMYSVDGYGNLNYNYEAFAVDWYTTYWTEYYEWENPEDASDINKVIEVSHGAGGTEWYCLPDYLKDKYDVDSTVEIVKPDDKKTISKADVEQAVSEGKSVTLSAEGYDLYEIDPKTGKVSTDISYEDGEAHAMSITGFTPEGDMKVSSWGKEYVVKSDGDKGDWAFYYIFDLNE